MILTCPDCATRYFVDDAKLGAGGKAVRCAACGARWTASVEQGPELELHNSPEIGAMAFEPALAADPELTNPPLPHSFRAKAAEKNAMRRAAMHGMIWGGMAAALAAVIGLAVVFRVEVVQMLPRAASAYAMAGLKVNALGLTFEGVSAHPALQDGHAALVVSGAVRNIEGQPVVSPALRINVLDKAGARVASQITPIEDARIAPGQAHNFVISVLDPPPSAETVEVVFEMSAKPRALPLHAAKPAPGPKVAQAAPTLRPASDPDPVPAVPLPMPASAATDTGIPDMSQPKPANYGGSP